MKQVRLKVKVLSEVDMATHFINWDKWLHEELEQKGSDEWQSVGVYDLDDRNDRILIGLVERLTTRHLQKHGVTFKISKIEAHGEC